MAKVNENYAKLPGSYLFAEIARRAAEYSAAHPDANPIKMGKAFCGITFLLCNCCLHLFQW